MKSHLNYKQSIWKLQILHSCSLNDLIPFNEKYEWTPVSGRPLNLFHSLSLGAGPGHTLQRQEGAWIGSPCDFGLSLFSHQLGDLVTHWSHSPGVLNSLDTANEQQALSSCQKQTKTCRQSGGPLVSPKDASLHPAFFAEPHKSPRCRQDDHGRGEIMLWMS